MATATQVPVEVYLRNLDHEPDCEYVDGVIEERPVGEFDHASWQYAIQRWFIEQGSEWNIRVRSELRVQVSLTRYRVPDVLVIDKSLPIEQILTYPPIAVFEVLSPEDRMSRMLAKLRDYELMGVQTIVVIDPETDLLFQYKKGVQQEISTDRLNLEGSSCSIDWRRVRELLKD